MYLCVEESNGEDSRDRDRSEATDGDGDEEEAEDGGEGGRDGADKEADDVRG